ncbi:hypothetical protein L873DRAFT_1725348, partial [Choiromyces venosus 120613-1]
PPHTRSAASSQPPPTNASDPGWVNYPPHTRSAASSQPPPTNASDPGPEARPTGAVSPSPTSTVHTIPPS